MKICKFLFVGILSMIVFSASAQDPVKDKSIWTPFGNSLNAMVTDSAHNQLIMGGYFEYVGPQNSYMASVDLQTFEPDLIQNSPNGWIFDAVNDGAGGWYISGDFTKVGEELRSGLAHVLADGSLDAWAPVVEGKVRSLLLVDSILFIGGGITSVNGELRRNLAGINIHTGELNNWEPKVAGGVYDEVLALAERNDTVYVGGDFQSANEYGIHGTQVNALTGVVDTFFIEPNSRVRKAITDNQGGWYIAGDFSKVGDQSRSGLAHMMSNGELSEWNPNLSELSGRIKDMALNDGKLYVVGNFIVSNDSIYRVNGMALDTATAKITEWNPRYKTECRAIEIVGDTVYAGGKFQYVGSWAQNGIQTDTLSGLNYGLANDFNGKVRASIPDGNGGWYVAGEFTKVNNIDYKYLAHIDSLGPVGNFRCEAADVRSMALHDGVLYLGGSFTNIQGVPAKNLIAVDPETGDLLPIDFKCNGPVNSIRISGDTLYAAGEFNSLGGKTRLKIGAINLLANQAIDWKTGFETTVYEIEIVGDKIYTGGHFGNTGSGSYGSFADKQTGDITFDGMLADAPITASCADGNDGWYLAGSFTTLKDNARVGLGQLNSDGSIGSWSHAVDGEVVDMHVFGDTLIIVGEFTLVDGETRENFAAFSISNDILLPWNPAFDEKVETIEKVGSRFFVGGNFDSVDGVNRDYFAEFDFTTGVLQDWSPYFEDPVYDIEANAGFLYVAGVFQWVDDQSRKRLASFDLSTNELTGWSPAFNNYVSAMAFRNNELYVCGNFTQINNVTIPYVVGFNVTTGQKLYIPEFSIFDREVSVLEIDGDQMFTNIKGSSHKFRVFSLNNYTLNSYDYIFPGKIYTFSFNANSFFFGGDFNSVYTGSNQKYLAALDRTNGSLLNWNPNPSGPVDNLVADGENLYVSGNFTTVSGSPRNRFAAFSLSSGNLLDTTFPIAVDNGEILDMTVDSGNLYVVGFGLPDNDIPGSHFSASFRLSDFTHRPWYIVTSGSMYTISVDGNKIFAGGNFGVNELYGAGGVNRNGNLTASNDLDGTLIEDWSFSAHLYEVNDLATDGQRLFIGGKFSTVQNVPRTNLAAIDLGSRTLLPWTPEAESTVKILTLYGDTLYMAGDFDALNGVERNGIGALNAVSGATLEWYPETDGLIRTLHANENAVYIGGDFQTVEGETRNRIAAVDRVSGEVTPWNPIVTGYQVFSIDTYSDQVYVAGQYDLITGTIRNNLAAFNRISGDLLNWAPDYGQVLCMEHSDMGLFVGGGNEAFYNAIALFDYASGSEISMDISIPLSNYSNVTQIELNDDRVYFGGHFAQVNGQDRNYIAAMDYPELTLSDWSSGDIAVADFGVSGDTIWVRTREDIPSSIYTIKPILRSGEILSDEIKSFYGSFSKLIVQNDRLFAFGDCKSLGGVARDNVAAIDMSSGRPNALSIPGSPRIQSLTIDDEKLYLGTFDDYGNYNPLLAHNLNTNLPVAEWQPELVLPGGPGFGYSYVPGLYAYNNVLYATSVAAENLFLKLDGTTGNELEMDWPIFGTGAKLFGDDNLFIIGGSYSQTVNPFEIYNLDNQLPMPWENEINGGIQDVDFDSGYAYVAGNINSINGITDKNIFRINMSDGVIDDFAPEYPFIPTTILKSTDKLFLGSNYTDNSPNPVSGGVQYINLETGNLSEWRSPITPSDLKEINGVLAVSNSWGNWKNQLVEYYQLSDCQTMPLCSDTTLYLDDEGMATISPELIDAGSTSTCEIEGLSLGIEDFNCGHLGENSIGLTVNTEDGYGASCNALITVIDTISPIITATDYNIQIPDSGVLHLNTQNLYGIATDNCTIDSIHILSGNTSYTCADQGNSFPIEVMVVDHSGNSTTGTVNMTIIASPICCATQATVLTSDTTICQGETIDISIELSGLPPFELNFAYNGISFPPVITADANYTLTVSPSVTTTYTFTSVTDQNCQGLVYNPELTINVLPVTDAGIDADTLFCASGDDLNLFTVFAANINVPGQFSPSSGLSQLAINSGTYYFIVNNDVCGFDTATFNVQIADTISIENVLVSCEDDPYFYQVSFDIEGGISPFQVNAEQWNDAFYESEFFSVLDSPSIEFTVSDGSGCPAQTITAQIEDSDDDGVCDAGEIVGCMLPTASNYNPLATDPSWCSFSPMAYPSFPDLEPTGGKGLGNYDTSMPVEKRTDFLDFQIAPNPSTTGTGLEAFINSGAKHELSIITIYSITGVKILEQSIEIEKGYNQIWIQNSMTVAAGIYLAAIKCGNERITRKFVITR